MVAQESAALREFQNDSDNQTYLAIFFILLLSAFTYWAVFQAVIEERER